MSADAAVIAARADVIHTSIEGAATAAMQALQLAQTMRDLKKMGDADEAIKALAPQVMRQAYVAANHMTALEEAYAPGDENAEPGAQP